MLIKERVKCIEHTDNFYIVDGKLQWFINVRYVNDTPVDFKEISNPALFEQQSEEYKNRIFKLIILVDKK